MQGLAGDRREHEQRGHDEWTQPPRREAAKRAATSPAATAGTSPTTTHSRAPAAPSVQSSPPAGFPHPPGETDGDDDAGHARERQQPLRRGRPWSWDHLHRRPRASSTMLTGTTWWRFSLLAAVLNAAAEGAGAPGVPNRGFTSERRGPPAGHSLLNDAAGRL